VGFVSLLAAFRWIFSDHIVIVAEILILGLEFRWLIRVDTDIYRLVVVNHHQVFIIGVGPPRHRTFKGSTQSSFKGPLLRRHPLPRPGLGWGAQFIVVLMRVVRTKGDARPFHDLCFEACVVSLPYLLLFHTRYAVITAVTVVVVWDTRGTSSVNRREELLLAKLLRFEAETCLQAGREEVVRLLTHSELGIVYHKLAHGFCPPSSTRSRLRGVRRALSSPLVPASSRRMLDHSWTRVGD
jgi:hypothetical protein